MRHLLIVLALLCASCATADDMSAPESSPESATKPATKAETVARMDSLNWLEQIAARADEIETLTARVRLEQITGLLGDEQTQVGDLQYAAGPPPRFAVHFEGHIVNQAMRKRDRRYVFDGRWLGEFNADDKALMRYELVPAGESADDLLALGRGPFPLPLSMDKDAVLQQFDVTVLEEDDDHVTLRFAAKNEDDKFREIDICYDRETLLPQRIEARRDEDATNVDLRDVKVDVELDDDTFDTALPAADGWTVQDNPAQP